MIITRSPLRVTLGGGGTDLPSYYREHGGFLIAAAIDKYVYVTVMRPFTPGIYLKYSKLEHVETVEDVHHPIIREAIKLVGFKTPQLEITTLADIPAGTGLGSSGSFTTALLKALYTHRRRPLHPSELAELACQLEIDKLGEPIGKQDQYIAAYGGDHMLRVRARRPRRRNALNLPVDAMFELEENLLLFFTGFARSAGGLLSDQNTPHDRARRGDVEPLTLCQGTGSPQPRCAGVWRHEAVRRAASRALGTQKAPFDEHEQFADRHWYELGRRNGAIGGKLVGAGGGGFLMFYSEDHRRLRSAMAGAGLEEVRFRFDFEGTKVLFA